MIYWEGIKYELIVGTETLGNITNTYYTEEALEKAIKEYGAKVVSFRKITNGIIVED